VSTTAQLRREITRLRERQPSRWQPIPADRLEFAHSLGIVPDSWQERALRSEAGRVLFNCSRQSGKSTTAGILALHKALISPDALVLILAPAERQAKELFTKVAEFYGLLGQPVPADRYRKLGMALTNGSRIEALPGTEKTIRGFSGVDLLIVDEAARVDDGLYFAVRPMLAVSGGRLMMLSTPAGRRGVFHEEWVNGEGWERYEIPAEEVPRIPPEFLAEERAALPAFIYEQEYCCRFIETEDQLFGYDLVASSITDEVAPLFGEAS
jgi:Terminase large subunit, T4likevirus-type, N-terminal